GAPVLLAVSVPGLSHADLHAMNIPSFSGQQPSIPLDRRTMLKHAAAGFGYLAFAGLCAEAANPPSAKPGPLSPRAPHHRPRARRVISLFMHGGPSQTDPFDYKPRLNRENGEPCPFQMPKVVAADKRSGNPPPLLGSPWKFRQHGASGL